MPAASEQAQIASLRAEAEEAKREAKETADLLADLSHEMRTPLNAVIGFAGAMRAEMFGPLGHEKYDEYAEHIHASGEHLLDLVSSILDLAKIEADRFSLKREAVNAGALAEECAGIVRLSAEAAGLTLTTRIAPSIPDSFLDARAVRQIIINLLSNAVKFTSDGEITLSVEAEDGEIVLTVTDTGVGMSEAELAKLGARFTAAHGDGVRGAKGAGLGLALAFAFAELHGGSMKLSSAPGEGLTARVALPVVAPASPSRRRREAVSMQNPALLTQLDRIEAYRRERASAA
ncbi:MAG: HAMP domain-containing sensor histidine kinase, partial [Amphiplicatus sp.]